MKKIKVNDVELAYRDEGRDEGAQRPVVFLHAFTLSQRMWDEQVAALAPQFRVITLDWRGFGGSGFGEREVTMETFADDLAALLDALQVERATVCGLSMGGYAAFAFYRRHAARVASLILADTKAGADGDEARRARYEMAAAVRRDGVSSLPDQVLGKWLAPETLETRPRVAEQVRAMITGNEAEAVARAQEAMARRADSTPVLGSISCPALVIVGDKDTLTPPSEAEKIAAGVPGARLVTVPAAGHLSNLENPAPFNRALLDFLGS
jgi:3-oxoadipate enol-lactonase